MRKILPLLLFMSSAAQAALGGAVVDLSSPGELQALRDRRPEHYARVQAILRVAETRPGVGAGRWIETRFGASDVELLQWRVSDPPRLRVSFTLEHTRYTAEVVPNLAPVRAIPAR